MSQKTSDLDQALLKLREMYSKELPAKVAPISQLLQNILIGFSPESSVEIEKKIHKIAGSAGTYGFSELSNHAGLLEDALTKINTQNLTTFSSQQNTCLADWKMWFERIIEQAQQGYTFSPEKYGTAYQDFESQFISVFKVTARTQRGFQGGMQDAA